MTEEELAEVERLWKEGATINEIAYQVSYSAGWVYDVIRRNRERFPYRIGRQAYLDRELWLARIRGGRATEKQAAEAIGVTTQTIYRWLREENGAKE